MNYVIIGNSTAAIGCVEGIRQIDTKGRITIISDEPYHTYSRPLISYLLYGKTNEERMKYRNNEFYKEHKVQTILGHKAVSINKDKKMVTLDNQETVPYDKLLIAAGSRPFVPPMKGLESVKEKFTFMTLDDAYSLEKAIHKESKVLVVGAGLIGLKCVEGILERVQSVTVVDLADRILPSILDKQGAAMVQSYIEEKGVQFILNDCVEEFSAASAQLKSGKKIDFDILVIAVGVRPNTELLRDIGGKVSRGIVIDTKSKTSVKDIFAAGDCTECMDITSDEYKVLALLPNAYMQGETAGINMAGGKASFDKAIPMNAIGFFGYHIITAGSYIGEDQVTENGNQYKKLFTKDDLLKGYIMVGNVTNAGIYTSLIREKTPLSSIDFELIKEKPQLMAFSKKDRKVKLGGAKA